MLSREMLHLKMVSVNTTSISKSSFILNALMIRDATWVWSHESLEGIKTEKLYLWARSCHHLWACWPFSGYLQATGQRLDSIKVQMPAFASCYFATLYSHSLSHDFMPHHYKWHTSQTLSTGGNKTTHKPKNSPLLLAMCQQFELSTWFQVTKCTLTS